MFNRKEVKEIIWKKWLFPDFTNKLTWLVAGAGVTILLTPTPLKQLFYNWLVDTFNLNSGEYYTLADLQSNTADYWLGFGVILLSLLHNIGYRVFIYKTDKLAHIEKQKLIEVDKVLFNKFIELLPSDGLDVKILEEHDFGNSHHGNNVNALDTFVHTWNNAQKQFLDTELESKRSDFITKSRHFIYTLASRSYAIGNGEIFSCIPDAYRNAWEWPAHIDEQVKELNDLGTELFELHKDLIITARRKLKC
ncbi:hypothetical protein [Shewanella japonica]|uniref:hypothetical protein n=1 Tax=Shewanella japonica TaxID=93973 RepID=UPI002494643C|nr:hypothetical protein [Shewanella japonica]